jgi:hypothetical protein
VHAIFCSPAQGGALVVNYSLFCTDVSTPLENMRVVSANLVSMGAAIKTACRLIGDGVIVWKIEGPDGFIMERSDIEAECLRRRESPLPDAG